MIIAVDFDGTLCIEGRPNLVLFARLQASQRAGNIVILWTCREGKRLNEAVTFCRKHGLIPNCVNRNHPAGIAIMGHDSRKVYADLYIDDKNMRGC